MSRKLKFEQEQNIEKLKIQQEELSDLAFNVVKDPKTMIITEEGQEEITTVKRKKTLKYEGCDNKKRID